MDSFCRIVAARLVNLVTENYARRQHSLILILLDSDRIFRKLAHQDFVPVACQKPLDKHFSFFPRQIDGTIVVFYHVEIIRDRSETKLFRVSNDILLVFLRIADPVPKQPVVHLNRLRGIDLHIRFQNSFESTDFRGEHPPAVAVFNIDDMDDGIFRLALSVPVASSACLDNGLKACEFAVCLTEVKVDAGFNKACGNQDASWIGRVCKSRPDLVFDDLPVCRQHPC